MRAVALALMIVALTANAAAADDGGTSLDYVPYDPGLLAVPYDPGLPSIEP